MSGKGSQIPSISFLRVMECAGEREREREGEREREREREGERELEFELELELENLILQVL